MSFPTQSVQLDAAQVKEMARHLSAFRHDVNGCLALVVAATELIRYSPDVVKRMATTLTEQPPRICGKTREFIQQCERDLGIRPAGEPSWYADLWKRYRAGTTEVSQPTSIPPDTARMLHGELLKLHKDLSEAAFIISGASVIAAAHPRVANEVSFTAAEQLKNITKPLLRFTDAFEAALGTHPLQNETLRTQPACSDALLSPEQIAFFHGRLTNLQEDIDNHVEPLLELGRLARTHPEEVQIRLGDFLQQPAKIKAVVDQFATEFDQTLNIVRS